MTKIQEHILAVVVRLGRHMSPEQILAEVRKQHPKVAIGTIYRNLSMFADTRKIRRVQRADGPDYFEANLAAHDHAICMRCGEMCDIKIPGLKDFLRANMAFDIVSFDLTIQCVCPACGKAPDESTRTKESGNPKEV